MAPLYDVFLSHSTADKPAVEKLAQKLVAAGITPFLDKWHLIPGRLWQSGLEAGLRDSGACVIFVGAEGFGPWHRQEMLVALDRGARDPDYPIIPVLLPGFRKPAEIPAFLAQRGWVEFADLKDEDAFHGLVCGIQGKPPGPGFGISAVSPAYRCMAQPAEGFIHRSEYEKVLEALCPKDRTARSSPSVGITTALRGAGGFGKTLQTLEGHTASVNAVAVLDGRRAVSASDDGTLRVWDLESGVPLVVMTLDAPVWAVAGSPDDRIVVAGDRSGRVHFFDWVVPE